MPEEFLLPCECGNRIAVSPAKAGSTVRCICGREPRVPGLSKLRRLAGRDEYITNTVEMVRKAMADGDLPGPACVHCRGVADRLIHFKVICERAYQKQSTTADDADFIGVFGRLLSPIWITRRTIVNEKRGRDTVVEASFRLCDSCLAAAGNPRRAKTLKRLVNMTPQYAALLQEYPEAKLAFVNATG